MPEPITKQSYLYTIAIWIKKLFKNSSNLQIYKFFFINPLFIRFFYKGVRVFRVSKVSKVFSDPDDLRVLKVLKVPKVLRDPKVPKVLNFE